MTGKELLIQAIQGNETPRPAWLPFVGVHGGKLIDKDATAYLKQPELLEKGLRKAIALYKPDGMPVVFDLQVEAEVLGCELHWADDAPPAVTTHPLMKQSLEELPPFSIENGRFPMILEVLDRLQADFKDDIAFYGLVCGPFTMALHLLGNDIFLDMFDEPDEVKKVINFAADVAIASAKAYIEHGATVIAVVDPMTSQISPAHFADFVTPSENRVFEAIREMGAWSSMFVCGDATRNLEEMVRTGADNVSVDEQISMEQLRDLAARYGKSFGGNIKLTSVLLLGDPDDNKREVIDIMDRSGAKGFILAPGCDLPYNTPPENLEAVAEMVHDEYAREIARQTLGEAVQDTFDDIEVPDYRRQIGVVIDVITLDSTSCAPCQYMMEAVERAAEATPFKVYINEHKIKVRAGLGMMAKLGVRNLPTICIDGEVRFASIIPDQTTLVKAIEDAGKVKLST